MEQEQQEHIISDDLVGEDLDQNLGLDDLPL